MEDGSALGRADILADNSIIRSYYKMEDSLELLFTALKMMDSVEAIRILRNHPEFINMRRIDDCELEVTTPLIMACKHGRWTVVLSL